MPGFCGWPGMAVEIPPITQTELAISTAHCALMGHCGTAVTVLPHGMLFLCTSHTPTRKGVVSMLIYTYARLLQRPIKRPTAQANAIKGPNGPQKSVLGPGRHGKL